MFDLPELFPGHGANPVATGIRIAAESQQFGDLVEAVVHGLRAADESQLLQVALTVIAAAVGPALAR